MATLLRARTISPPSLDLSIPTPFPREQLPQSSVELPNEEGFDKTVSPFEVQGEEVTAENPFENEAGPSTLAESGIATPDTYTLVRNMIILPLCSKIEGDIIERSFAFDKSRPKDLLDDFKQSSF